MPYYFLLLAVMLGSFSLTAQEETFRKYYGQDESYSREIPTNVASIGDELAVIGVRENLESRSFDIAFWFFEPENLTLLDSLTWTQPGEQQIADIYPGPDGGVLIHYYESYRGSSSQVFAYFGPDRQLSWKKELTGTNPLLRISSLSFKSPSELVFSVWGNNNITPALFFFSATDGVTNQVQFPANGLTVTSVERQSDGRLLVGGQELGVNYLMLLNTEGEEVWRTNIPRTTAAPLFYADGYLNLKGAHWLRDDDRIVVTGRHTDGLYVTVLDTTGSLLHDELIITEPSRSFFEQTTWISKDSLFISSSIEGEYAFVTFDEFRMESFRISVNDPEDLIRRGTYFSPVTKRLYSTYHNRSPFAVRDIFLQRIVPTTGTSKQVVYGTPWYQASEFSIGLTLLPEGGYMMLADWARGYGQSVPTMVEVDREGNLVRLTPLADDDDWFGVYSEPTADNNVRISFRQDDSLVVNHYTTSGELLQHYSFPVFNNEIFSIDPVATQKTEQGELWIVDALDGSFFQGLSSVIQRTDGEGGVVDTLFFPEVYTDSETTGLFKGHGAEELIYSGQDSDGTSILITSLHTISGEKNWQTRLGLDDTDRIYASDVVALPNGRYGVAVLSDPVFNGESIESYIFFSLLNASGQEILRDTIDSSTNYKYDPLLHLTENGRLLLAWGDRRDVAINEEQVYTTEIRALDPVSGSVLDTIFHYSPEGLSLSPNKLTSLPDGRIVMYGHGFEPGGNTSRQLFLLVIGEEGTIVTAPGIPPLSMKVDVFPNPATTVMQVKVDDGDWEQLSLRLIDGQGRILYYSAARRGTQFNEEINVRHLTSGLYYLHLQDEKGRQVFRKVVKQ
ncbi:T9SS type A sorting domain-containing protein [Neolewinella persica]|uniref:T9SS type A sorting domain-containing protein n=1 Tax=Neolewinella persica TaxID=70998 RepID=UPI000477B55D|nr:T9SS type A sorting domain-containing protein [Neolewinella persica]